MSLPQTVAIVVLTTISPGRAAGVGTSMISTLPLAVLMQARMGQTSVYVRERNDRVKRTIAQSDDGDKEELILTRGRLVQGVQERDQLFVDLLRAFLLRPVATAGEHHGLAKVGDERLHRLRVGE